MRNIQKTLRSFFILSFFFLSALSSMANASQKELQKLKQQLKATQSKLVAAQTQIQMKKKELDALHAQQSSSSSYGLTSLVTGTLSYFNIIASNEPSSAQQRNQIEEQLKANRTAAKSLQKQYNTIKQKVTELEASLSVGQPNDIELSEESDSVVPKSKSSAAAKIFNETKVKDTESKHHQKHSHQKASKQVKTASPALQSWIAEESKTPYPAKISEERRNEKLYREIGLELNDFHAVYPGLSDNKVVHYGRRAIPGDNDCGFHSLEISREEFLNAVSAAFEYGNENEKKLVQNLLFREIFNFIVDDEDNTVGNPKIEIQIRNRMTDSPEDIEVWLSEFHDFLISPETITHYLSNHLNTTIRGFLDFQRDSQTGSFVLACELFGIHARLWQITPTLVQNAEPHGSNVIKTVELIYEHRTNTDHVVDILFDRAHFDRLVPLEDLPLRRKLANKELQTLIKLQKEKEELLASEKLARELSEFDFDE